MVDCCVSLLAVWCLGFPWLVAVWWLLNGFDDDGVGFLAMQWHLYRYFFFHKELDSKNIELHFEIFFFLKKKIMKNLVFQIVSFNVCMELNLNKIEFHLDFFNGKSHVSLLHRGKI